MHAQAASNAAVKNGLVGHVICEGPSRQGTSFLVASSSLERKAPGKKLFVQDNEKNDISQRRTWKGMGIMIKSHKATGKQVLKFVIASIAASCPGAAVFAAPMTITPKAKIFGPSQRSSETKSAYAALSKGPAFQLGRAATGEDEDCVRVTRIANCLLGFTRLLTTILNVADRRSSKYDGEAYTDIYTLIAWDIYRSAQARVPDAGEFYAKFATCRYASDRRIDDRKLQPARAWQHTAATCGVLSLLFTRSWPPRAMSENKR
jgi:hypothetical protein